jgi:hypothetical protein
MPQVTVHRWTPGPEQRVTRHPDRRADQILRPTACGVYADWTAVTRCPAVVTCLTCIRSDPPAHSRVNGEHGEDTR